MIRTKIYLSLLLLCLISYGASAQQKVYSATGGETIFSYGDVGSDSTDITPILRFSPFFNLQQQFHFNFSEHAGIYTGLGLRNVGLISHVTDINHNTETIKERSYSLGLPLAFEFGDLNKGTSFALGAEAEIMFAYKRKVMQDKNKTKYDAWFDNNVNVFNPSAFAELKFKGGQYIRFKYYLMDFLNYQGVKLISGETIADYGPSSPLFYVSLGMMNFHKELSSHSPTKPATQSAYFRSSKKHDSLLASSLK